MALFRRRPRFEHRVTSLKDLERIDFQQDIELKGMYARRLLWLLGIQLVAADALVYLYAGARDWGDIPEGVIQAWLAATVVQLIGVVLVVTKYLFSRRDVS